MPFSPGSPQAGSLSTRSSQQLRNVSPEWGQPRKQRAKRLNGLHCIQIGHKMQHGPTGCSAAAAQGWQLPEPPSSSRHSPAVLPPGLWVLEHSSAIWHRYKQHTCTLLQRRAALHSLRLHCSISTIAFFFVEQEPTHSLESHASWE